MAVYIANAFSLNMLAQSEAAVIEVRGVSEETVRSLLENTEFTSAVGHESTAKVLSKRLGINIEYNRAAIKLERGDVLIVPQLTQRLQEGAVLSEEELREIPIRYFVVTRII